MRPRLAFQRLHKRCAHFKISHSPSKANSRNRFRLHLLEQLEPRLVMDSQWQNPARPTDVNNDRITSPLDALLVINLLNKQRGAPLPPRTNPLDNFYDTSGDGRASPLDALLVINRLRSDRGSSDPRQPGETEVGPAGFLSLPLTALGGTAGQVVRLKADLTIGRVEFNEMGVFVADDASGRVNGVAPTSIDYPKAVFQLAQRRVLFSRRDEFKLSTTVDLPAGQHLRVYVLQAASRDGDVNKHLRVTDRGNSTLQVGWEEHPSAGGFQNVGDRGFDDALVAMRFETPININSAPVFTSLPDRTVPELTTITFDATAFDADLPADQIRYSLDNPPAGASINPTNGVFSWTPTEAQGPGTFTVIVRATDNSGAFDTESVTIQVLEVNLPPTLASIANVDLRPGDSWQATAQGSDPDLPANQLTYSVAPGAPASFSIDSRTGLMRFNAPASDREADYPITITVRDNGSPSLSASRSFNIRVTAQRTAPVLDPLPDRTIPEMTESVFTITARDLDLPNDTLRYSIVTGPASATLDQTTGTFRWTPTEGQGPGNFPVTMRVTDRDGRSDSKSFTLTVTEVNRPPVLDPIGTFQITASQSVGFSGRATDPDLPLNTLTYSIEGNAPPGFSLNPTTGQFSWTSGAVNKATQYDFLVRATDNGSPTLSATQPVTITVVPQIIELVEEDRFITQATLPIVIGADTTQLQFSYQDLRFDQQDSDSINDAFEVALVDSRNQPLVGIITPNRDGLYNRTEELTTLLGAGTTFIADSSANGGTLRIDVSHLPAGLSANLIVRLVNNDSDNTTRVRFVPHVTQIAGTRGALNTATPAAWANSLNRTSRVYDDSDWRHLADVTSAVMTTYDYTAYDIDSQRIGAGVTLRNNSNFPIRGPLLITVSGITSNDASLVNTAGLLPRDASRFSDPAVARLAGSEFFDATQTLPLVAGDQTLLPGESMRMLLEFENTSLARFDYQIHVLGTLNRSPQFNTNAPDSVRLGNVYRYDSGAVDPDEDPLVYSLVNGPSGLTVDATTGNVTWTPTASDVGTHSVTLRTVDPFGASDTQHFTINVFTATAINRPPVFTSDPVIDASVGVQYSYPSRAADPDFDALTYSIVSGPAGMSIIAGPSDPSDPNDPAGNIVWTPPASAIGTYVPVTLRAIDGRGGEAFQDYRIYVRPNPINQPPVIVTQPESTFRVPLLEVGASQGDVTPRAIQEVVARGSSTTRDVSLQLPPNVNVDYADIVLVVDESGSMGEQAWIATMISQLDASLQSNGLVDNRYAIVGYGSAAVAPRIVTEDDPSTQNGRMLLRVYGPQGEALYSDWVLPGQRLPEFSFPVDGSYVVSIMGDVEDSLMPVTSSQQFRVRGDLTSPQSVPRTGWGRHTGRVSGSIEIPLTASSGDVLLIDGITGRDVTRKLIGPDGRTVVAASSLLLDPDPLVLTQSGTYRLVLSGDRIDYDLRLHSPLSDATPITFDSAIAGRLQSNETLLYRIDAAQPLTLWVDRWLRANQGPGDSAATRLRLLGPSGLMTTVNVGATAATGHGDLGPSHVVAGSYVLLVDAGPAISTQPRDYSFMARNLSAPKTALQPGVTQTATLPSAGGAALFEFSAQRGQRFEANLPVWTAGAASWRVLDAYGLSLAGGALIAGQAGQSIGNVPIREDGRYVLAIESLPAATQSSNFQIVSSFTTTQISNYSGTSVLWDVPNTGLTSGSQAAQFIVDMQAGEQFFATTIVQGMLDDATLSIRSPSGGVLYEDEGTGGQNTFSYRITSDRMTAHQPGRYLIEVRQSGSQMFGSNVLLQLASVRDPFPLGQLATVTTNPGPGVRAFKLAAQAGDLLTLSDGSNLQAWADATLAAQRAGRLEISGGTEDGYWGIDFAIDNLDFRPAAAKHIILVTDEDRDVERPLITRETLANKLAASGLGLHALVQADFSEPNGTGGPNIGESALGVWPTIDAQGNSVQRMFFPQGSSYRTLDVDRYIANGSENTVADYVDMVSDLEGTSWNIMTLRQGGTQSFTAAFVDTLSEIVQQQVIVGLRPVATTASGLPRLDIGQPTIVDRTVTFPVTFYGDGDGWNFDLEFFDTARSGIAYGQVPVALAAGYRYDVLAIDPEDEDITYRLTGGSEHGARFDPVNRTVFWNPTTPGQYNFSITASDPWGGSDEQSWTVTVAPPALTNAPPTIAPMSNVVQEADRLLSIDLAASDADGDTLTYRLLPGANTRALPPTGLQLDPATGRITWRPTRTQLGTHEVTVQVVDGRGGRATTSFAIEVIPRRPNSNLRPVITSRPVATAPVGLRYRYDVQAHDPDGDAITYSLAAAPTGLVIDRTSGVLSWLPDNGDIGQHSVVVRATDEVGGVTLQAYELAVMLVNDPPEITSRPEGRAVPGTRWNYQVTAIDPNGDVLRYSLVPGQHPVGATIDSSTGLLTWTPATTGAFRFLIEVADGRGGRARQEFTLPVSDAAPPSIVSIPTGPARVGERYEYLVVALDPNTNDPVTLRLDAVSVARGATLTNAGCPAAHPNCATAALLVWTPNSVGEFPFTVTATDSSGNTATQNFTLPVVQPASVSHPPLITSRPTGPALRNQLWQYPVIATDPDGDAITYRLGQAPTGMTIDRNTGLVSWTPSATNSGVTIEVIAEDARGAWSMQSFQLPVVERLTNAAPVFTSIATGPATINQAWQYAASAFDPDGDAVTYSLDAAALAAGITINSTTGHVTWTPRTSGQQLLTITAQDPYGGASTQTITLPIQAPPNLPPTFVSVPTGPAFVGRAWTYTPRATDPEGDTLRYSLGTTTPTNVSIDPVTARITYTPTAPGAANIVVIATDTAGNRAEQLFTLPAVTPPSDSTNRPPVFSSSPVGPARVDQEWIYLAQALDADGDAITYALDSAAVAAGLAIESATGRIRWTPRTTGSQSIEVSARDTAGNLAFQRFDLAIVRANRAPVIESEPSGPVVVGRAWTYSVVTSDPDGDSVTLSLDDASRARGTTLTGNLISWTPSAAGNFTLIVTANDGRGAQATQTIQLTVTAPNSTSSQPPRFRSLPPRETPLGAPLNYRADAFDPDGTTVHYALTRGVVGMTIDTTTGLLSWRPDQLGQANIEITAIDQAGERTVQAFTLNVIPGNVGNEPPIITSTPRGPAVRNLPYQYPVIARDPNGDALTYSLDSDSLARGMTISAQGLIQWLPTTANNFPVTVTVRDALGASTSQNFTLTVISNAPPQITSPAPTRLELGQTLSYTVIASDPNPGDTLTYSATSLAGLSIASTTGLLTWRPTTAGRFTFSVFATDNHLARDEQVIELLVIDPANNQAPTITGSPRQQIQFGAEYLWQVPATDADNDELTFELVTGPAGLTIDTRGWLRWTPTAAQVTSGDNLHTITVRVSDGRGGSDTETWRMAVTHSANNQAPTIHSVQVRAIDYDLAAAVPAVLQHAVAGRPYQALFSARDPEGDALVWSLVEAPSGMRIDARGLIDYRPTAANIGNHNVNVRVTDTAGASDTFRFTLTVRGGNSPARISGNPPVHHRVNTLYATTFTATDNDNDAVTYRFVTGQPTHGAQLDATTGRMTWTPATTGTYRFFVAAVDPLGEGTQLVFDVLVDQFGPNDPPRFEDTQAGVAEVGTRYTRRFPATDPDGDTLTFAIEEGPAGLTIAASDGTVTWDAPASLIGTSPLVKLTARDPAGHTARYQFRLPVRAANTAPRFDSPPVLLVTAGNIYQYSVQTSDADSDPLRLTLVSGPTGLTLDPATGRIQWTTTTARIGNHPVTIAVTDDRIPQPLQQTWTITVAPDTAKPQLKLFASSTVVEIGAEVSFEVRASDNVAVTQRTLQVGSTNIALSSSGFGRHTFTTAGRFEVTATARDAAGNISTDQFTVLVRDPNNAAPQILIVSPTAGQQLTAPTDVALTVTDAERDLTSVRLLFAPADGSTEFRQFAALTATSGSTLGDLTNRTIGRFDPTNLANGSYIIRAIAEDAGFNQSTRDTTVQVAGRLKLGNFAVSFDDLTIPVSGMPITIVRSYDTLDANQSSDFGNGWTLDIRQARVRIDASTLGGMGSGRHQAFIDGTRVIVTTPEGIEEGFTFRAIPDQTLFGIALSWKSNFDPDPGNNYKLEAPAGGLRRLGSEYLSGFGTTYNPRDREFGNAFQVTSIASRITYNVNATTGETASIEDRNENKLELRYEGIISSTGRSVTFQRDMLGRIVAITDPRGNSLRYSYDSVGNLTSFTDRMGNTVRMTYHAEPAHYLDTVIDPLGNIALKATYKLDTFDGSGAGGGGGEGGTAASGRLAKLEDATGSYTAFEHNSQELRQTQRDADGILATVQYDTFGNPLDHSVRGGERTIRTFDDPVRGLPTTETQVIGRLDTGSSERDDITVRRTYNQWGQVTSETDHRGNVTRYLYNSQGVPTSTINPDGSSTFYSYDDKFNLTYTSSSTGGATSLTYDRAGQVTEVRTGDFSASGNVVKLKYNRFGEVIETEDTEQNKRTIAYDANGNNIGTEFTWTDPNNANNKTTLRTSSVVAPNDQPQSNTSTSGTSRVEFDTLNRPFRSIDENGLVSETRYDLRGLAIETRTQSLNENGAAVWLVSRTVYDADGQAIYTTNNMSEGTSAADTFGTHNIFDTAGRVVRTERRLGVDIQISGTPGKLTSRLVSAGRLITTSETQYDSSGRAWQTIDNYGRKSQTLFDRFGQTIETRTQSYDENGALVWLTSRTVYDSLGRVLLSTDRYLTPASTELGAGASPAFYATATLYDNQGRSIGSQRITGAVVTISGTAGNLTSAITARGTLLHESKTIYDTRGRVARSISPTGQITDYVYDARDRQIATIAHPLPAEQVGLGSRYPGKMVRLRSETEFNSYGQVAIQRTNVIQVEEADGRLVTVDRRDSRETQSRYDAEGRLVNTIFPDGSSVQSEYDVQGRVVAEINQLGLRRTFEYDASGRLTAVVLPEVINPNTGLSMRPRYAYGYDAQGNQTLLRDPLGRETRFGFDSLGRQVSRTLPLGFGLDGIQGTSDDAAVASGDWTERMTYDDRGRVETQVSFEGVVTRFVYDDTVVGGGRLSQQRFYPNLNAYQTAPNSPAETWSFEYDAFGREVSVVVTGAQPRRVTSHYDALGQLVMMNTPEGAIEYQYDDFARKTATRVGKPIANGQPLSSFTAERATQYTYDQLSRLRNVTEVVYATSGELRDVHHYFYDLLGSLDAELASNGLYKDYVYDNMQRLQALTHYRTDGTLADIADLSDDPRVVRFDYTVRADGRRTAANELWYTVGSATQSSPLQASYDFTYDNLGRLTDEVFDHWDNSLDYRDRFAYDPAGNRVEKSRDAGRDGSVDARTTYRFDVNDRLIDELAYARASDPESRTTYTYDYTQNTGYSRERFVNGSSSTSPTLTHVYTYDLQGRLFSATVTNYNDAGTASSITRSTYDYGHTGIRVSAVNEIDSTADGTFETRTKIEYLVDHSNHTGYQQVIRESHYDVATGKLVKTVDYTFGHDEISQTVVTYNSVGAEVSRDKQWFLHDGKANVRGLLDAASAILTIAGNEQIYFYDAYGSLLNLQASQAATTLLYNGEMFDALTGNQYLRARYYNPLNAQFNRLDPFFGNHQDPQSFNKYAYVHGDPVNGKDPSGESLVSGLAVGALIGASFGIVGNGLHNISQNKAFFENAGTAAFFGAGLGVLSVLFPPLGVLLAGVGFGSAIANWASVFSDPSTSTKQKLAASALVLLSAVGLATSSSYARGAIRENAFWYNPAGFRNFSLTSMRDQLSTAFESVGRLWEAHQSIHWSWTTMVGIFRKPNGELILRAMSNKGNGELPPGVAETLPAGIEPVQFDPAGVPAQFVPRSGNPHAEVRAYFWGKSEGLEMIAVGASKYICPACQNFLAERGVGFIGAVKGQNEPSFIGPILRTLGLRAAYTAGSAASGGNANQIDDNDF